MCLLDLEREFSDDEAGYIMCRVERCKADVLAKKQTVKGLRKLEREYLVEEVNVDNKIPSMSCKEHSA